MIGMKVSLICVVLLVLAGALVEGKWRRGNGRHGSSSSEGSDSSESVEEQRRVHPQRGPPRRDSSEETPSGGHPRRDSSEETPSGGHPRRDSSEETPSGGHPRRDSSSGESAHANSTECAEDREPKVEACRLVNSSNIQVVDECKCNMTCGNNTNWVQVMVNNRDTKTISFCETGVNMSQILQKVLGKVSKGACENAMEGAELETCPADQSCDLPVQITPEVGDSVNLKFCTLSVITVNFENLDGGRKGKGKKGSGRPKGSGGN